jgi:hypothetical protein
MCYYKAAMARTDRKVDYSPTGKLADQEARLESLTEQRDKLAQTKR